MTVVTATPSACPYLTDTESLVRLQYLYHLDHDQEAPSLPEFGFYPASLVSWSDDDVDGERVVSRLCSFRKDSEFEESFLQTIVFLSPARDNASLQIGGETLKVLRKLGCQLVFRVPFNDLSRIPEGPYFIRGQSLHRVWRLFPDVYETFQSPTIQEKGQMKSECCFHSQILLIC